MILTWVRCVHNSTQMIWRATKEQMQLIESIRLQTTRASKFYGYRLTEAEAYDAEVFLNNIVNLVVANALARRDGTQEAPNAKAKTLEHLAFRVETEGIAQHAIMDL